MNDRTQSLAEKIRRLELQGAELLSSGSGDVQSQPDRPAPSSYGNEALECDTRASKSIRFGADTAVHPKSYNGSSRVIRPQSCDEAVEQFPSRFRQLESDTEQADSRETTHADGKSERSTVTSPRRLSHRVLSFAGAQPPPPASKARLSLPAFGSSSQQSEAVEQSDILKMQLDEANRRCEQMRMQFRSTIEDLNRRLHETIAEKESLQESRQKNELAQDDLIARLQASLRELREAYEVQERALTEADSRSELLRTVQAEHEQMAAALRQAVSAAEQRQLSRCPHGSSAATAPLPSAAVPVQRAALLLQHWLEEADSAVKARDARIAELEREVEDRQKSSIEVQLSFEKSAEEKVARLKESSTKLLQAAEERSDNLREQLNSYRARATFLEEQMDQHAKANAEHVQGLENKISVLKAELQDEKRLISNKDLELKQMADDARRAAAVAAAHLDEASQQAAMLQKRIDTYEVMLERLRAECELERSQSQRLWRREEEVSHKRNEAEAKLAERDAEILRLRELISSLKEESARQLTNEVKMAESREREKSAEEQGILRRQLEAAARDHEQTATQLRSARAELQAALEKVRAVEARLESTQRDLLDEQDRLRSASAAHQEAVTESVRLAAELRASAERHDAAASDQRRAAAERDSMSQQLDETAQRLGLLVAERDRYAAERDRYAAALTTSEAEASKLSAHAEHLRERLAEVDAAAGRARQEHAAVLDEITAARERELARAGEELARLQAALEQTVGKVQKLQTSEQQLALKLKASKIKLADQVAEMKRMEDILQQKDKIVQQLQKELEAKDTDVRACKESIASLVDERNILASALKGQEGQSQSEIGRLLEKLNALDRDYRLSQQTLQAKDSVDAKAIQAADRLQKELTQKRKNIDELMGKIRWLEECLEVSAKEKKSLAEANDNLAENIARLEERCSSSTVAATAEQLQQHRLQEKVHRLETELDRMAARCQQLQSAVHQSEQQTATLKLKQRLDNAAKACTVPASSSDGLAKSTGQRALSAGAPSSAANTLITTGAVSQPLHTRATLPHSEDHGTTADVKAMIMEVKAMLSAAQKETALSAGSAVRDALDAVLPALVTAGRSATVASMEHRLTRVSDDRSCRNTGALVVHKTSQRRGKRWSTQPRVREPDTSTLSEGDLIECDVSHLRKSHSKVVSRSLQIEATLRCQDLDDRLMGLSKMGRHLKTEHNVMMQLLKNQEQQMEYIHDDQQVKELLC